MAESNVRLATDAASTGKKIRQVLVRGVVQEDGTSADVYLPCYVETDKEGRSLDHDEIPNILKMVLREVRLLREMFGEMTENGGALGFGGDHDPGVNDDHDE